MTMNSSGFSTGNIQKLKFIVWLFWNRKNENARPVVGPTMANPKRQCYIKHQCRSLIVPAEFQRQICGCASLSKDGTACLMSLMMSGVSDKLSIFVTIASVLRKRRSFLHLRAFLAGQAFQFDDEVGQSVTTWVSSKVALFFDIRIQNMISL